ncbi:MFS transporter [Rhodococcus hoagii]|uniref:MFS transporter n=2 Tax=Rhodococcus hoagii TaxID=43767 RepID=UPI0012F9C967|nr:MFS transporter [Prescottella equi]NKS41575.1 MFS transporter [Prescottella equi]
MRDRTFPGHHTNVTSNRIKMSSSENTPSHGLVRRASMAGFFGTAVEAYDFMVFTFLITYLSPKFFPSDDPTTGILSSLAVLGTGFLARPIGGIVFGRIGDRYGRRFALILTISGMGGATILMGLLPTHSAVGILAPVLLVLTRLLQGFFAGGEQMGSATFVTEHASTKNYGFLSAMTPSGFAFGAAVAPLVVAVTTSLSSEDEMASWGWRIPLLMSLPLMMYVLHLRTRLEESPEFEKLAGKHEVQSAPLRLVVKRYPGTLLRVIAISTSVLAIGYVIPAYMPLFLHQEVGIPTGTTAWLATAGSTFAIVLGFAAGFLIDRNGRRKTMMLALGIILVTMFPIMYVIKATGGNLIVTALGHMLLVGLAGASAVPVYATLTSAFPAAVRYTGAAIGFGLGSALGGGLGPYLAGKLTAATGNPYAASIVVGGAALLGMVVIATMPNSNSSAAPATTLMTGDCEPDKTDSAGESPLPSKPV